MYKVISYPSELSNTLSGSGLRNIPMFCESYSSFMLCDKYKYSLNNVKLQKTLIVSRKLNKDNFPINKHWGLTFTATVEYCIEHDLYIVDSNLIIGFLKFSDEQMKSKDPNLDVEWTNKTLDVATVEANKILDERIKIIKETKGKRFY